MTRAVKAGVPAKTAKAAPPAAYDYGEDEGAGYEGQSSADVLIPFLTVLQQLSPQVEDIDAAKPGMLINTVTNDLFDGEAGVVFVPATTEHCYIEWVPRDEGGGGGQGFVGRHEIDSDVVKKARDTQEFGKYRTEAGNHLVETFYVYGVLVTPDGIEPMVVAFSSTKIKPYKGWMTKARSIQIHLPDGRRITPPLFAHRFRITTIKQKNPKGTFHNFVVGFDGADASSARLSTDDEIYMAARSIKEMVQGGQAKADMSAGDGSEAGSSEDSPF